MKPLAIAVSVLLPALALGAPPAPTDPWASVPPNPTSCYWGVDRYTENVRAAIDTVTQARDRQRKIDDDLSSSLKSVEPMQLAAKMQEFMMAHPQEAAKVMGEAQSAGTEGTQAIVAADEKRKQFEAEKSEMFTRYRSAVDQALKPFDSKFKDLDARAQKSLVVCGESMCYAPWAAKEYNGLVAQRDAAYQGVCKDWWLASGQFPAWLGRYRKFLVEERIPPQERMDNAGAGIQIFLVETPSASFKSTAVHDGVIDYLNQVKDVFEKREGYPGTRM